MRDAAHLPDGQDLARIWLPRNPAALRARLGGDDLAVWAAGDRAAGRPPERLSRPRRRCGGRDFRRDHPRVDLDVTVDQSGTLHRRLENDRVDLFVGKQPRGEERGKLVKRERLVWVGTPTTRLDPTPAGPGFSACSPRARSMRILVSSVGTLTAT
jgi:LysR substrate binding domain